MTRVMRVFILPSLVFLAMAGGCADNDDDPDGVVLDATAPAGEPGDSPEVNEVPGMIKDQIERHLSDKEWVNDIEDIRKDGDTVRFKLDRAYTGEADAFRDACEAVAEMVVDAPLIDVDAVEVEDRDGNVALATRAGGKECEVVRR